LLKCDQSGISPEETNKDWQQDKALDNFRPVEMISAFSVLFCGLSAVSFIGGFVSSAKVSRDKRLYSSIKAL
jgi:hypothetical protein